VLSVLEFWAIAVEGNDNNHNINNFIS